ncbi:MAG TPA: carbohydrate porin [Candidatus Acidoferrum sp.]|nr:carbohydrate porin [Candidatus Acidoferrum sp.]
MKYKNKAKTRSCKIVTALAATGAVASCAFGQATNAPAAKDGMISLVGLEPAINYAFRRNLEFYGDPNTEGGNLWDRTQLTGNWGGLRDQAVARGVYLDASVTQFLQGDVSGGKNQGPARYNGSADYWLTVDSGKAGLWPGGAIFAHAESSWQANKSVNGDTGSLLPANYDATMPSNGRSDNIALPELYLAQGLPGNLLAMVGKVDFAGIGDQNLFANNERTEFLYTGLVNNPILGSFLPYTPLGAALDWAPSKEHNLAVLGVQSDGNGTTAGFDNFNGNYAVGSQYTYSPTLAGHLPGDYHFLVAYSTKSFTDFNVNSQDLIGEIIGKVPVSKKDGNYCALASFDQYLWTRDASETPADAPSRKGLPLVGVGLFFRAGWEPQDRNVIDQFYSFGIGGYGGLPGRDRDQWGLGWAGTHISGDVRNDLKVLGRSANEFENAVETFYNFAVTPAMHISLDLELITSAAPSVDTAVVLGTRFQFDF